MKHEFPEEVLKVAKRLGISNDELDAIHEHFLHPMDKIFASISSKDLEFVTNRPFKINDVETIEFTEDQNQFLNELIVGNNAKDLTEAMQC